MANAGIELSARPSQESNHAPLPRRATGIDLETPGEKQQDDHAAGKLPPEAPPPVKPYELHVQSLKNLVSAGLDMKNKADYDALVHPLMARCGGSIEALASKIAAPLTGGLKSSDNSKDRQSAFGVNRLPEKELVRLCCAANTDACGDFFACTLDHDPPQFRCALTLFRRPPSGSCA